VRFDETLARVADALQGPLPGEAAQDLLSPIPRREWPPDWNPARTRHAAGLLLLYPLAGEAHVVLTRRSDAVRHGGQVSMPGGGVEPGETFEQAALREAHEEVDLDGSLVQVLGRLTPVDIPVSGFRLHPIVAAARERPALRPADAEVARILDVAIARLLDPTTASFRSMTRDGVTRQVPLLVVPGGEIWGATAMVLAEFLALLGWKGAGK
jgi:8-oxo-dGTP pyrophosphatase MutT (NUDIX family)